MKPVIASKGGLDVWVAIAGLVSVLLARASRSAQVARELLGSRFAGIVESSRYAGYAWIEAPRHQVCWAYLLRDFTNIFGDSVSMIFVLQNQEITRKSER